MKIIFEDSPKCWRVKPITIIQLESLVQYNLSVDTLLLEEKDDILNFCVQLNKAMVNLRKSTIPYNTHLVGKYLRNSAGSFKSHLQVFAMKNPKLWHEYRRLNFEARSESITSTASKDVASQVSGQISPQNTCASFPKAATEARSPPKSESE